MKDEESMMVPCPRCQAPVGYACQPWCEVRDGYDTRKAYLIESHVAPLVPLECAMIDEDLPL